MLKNTTLLLLLTLAVLPVQATETDFGMEIGDMMRLSGQGVILTGKIATGTVRNGDWLCVPLNNGSQVGRQVKGMEKISKVVETASAGENIGILVDDLKEEQIAVTQTLTSGCAN